METVELNIRAKGAYEAFQKRQRRNKMAYWRTRPTLVFDSQDEYDNWLNYTKWHKRPMKVELIHGLLYVEFLDYKGKNV